NTDLFNEWSQQFTSDNIDMYIDDLKAIYTWVENADEISSADWASIPWMYIDVKTGFITADKVYWSSAFSNLSSEHFETIKSILHGAEIKTLPLQTCGEIINSFKLKTDDSSSIVWSKIKGLEMLSANTLLDWMEFDGDFGNFFEEYTLKVDKDGLYSISEIEEIQIYNGSDIELSAYIQSNEELTTLFSELDKDLCSEDRYKIGLLQGDKLLKAIIDSCAFDQNLAAHLSTNMPLQLLQNFITNLSEFTLKTSVEYGSYSSEHFIINQLLRSVEDINAIPIEIQNTIDVLRRKITINEKPLSDYNISDRVSFGVKEDRKVLKLSDILTEFLGDSDEMDNVKESFTAVTQKEKLKKLIFKTIPLSPDQIYEKIEDESSDYYSIHQVVFQMIDNAHGGQRNWSKQDFDDYYKEKGNVKQLENSYQSFMNILIDLPLVELSDFDFHDLVLSNCVDENYAIDSERIPKWLEDWVNIDKAKRLEFIAKLGYNGTDSSIVKLRKAAISEDFDSVSVIGHYANTTNNEQITWNTIKWLSNYSSPIITQNSGLIKLINNFVTFPSKNLSSITIPIIEAISKEGERMYGLKNIDCNSHLYFLPENDEFDSSIFTVIKNENENSIFIDTVCGEASKYFEVETVSLLESINQIVLDENSKLWEEPFYKKWEYYNDHPIYIYQGNEIPYKRTFNDIIINDFTSDLKVVNDFKYYVSTAVIKDILEHLPESFPPDMLLNLKEWERKTLKNESLLDEDSFEYREDIDRLLQDRLGISEEDQKRESGNAKAHAIYYLDEKGFDVSAVDNVGPKLTNIIDPDKKHVSCIVRSAKGGLLYLDQDHWDMLEDELMYLIVIYPGNSPRIFRNRLELLEEELAENVLFKVPNNKIPHEIDGVFKALESESHVILVTSEKMKESLFSKIKQKKDLNKDENAALGDDNFTF
ncbi:ATP-binding protein, partial [Flavobacteriales bacterium]|nr:ATP-binding protein [Flavobacteriales bacterium]